MGLLWSIAVVLVIFLLLVDLMHRRARWAPHYPPGPTPLPGLGNLLQLDLPDMPRSINRLCHRYGNVFSLQLAWAPTVVLNGLAAVREALVDRGVDTSDRKFSSSYQHLGFGPRSEGIIMAHYGPRWREQRHFSMSTLRNFGLGKKSLEQWVIEEASYLCAAFADQAGHLFRPNSLLMKAVSNVIASLIFARRFEYDDPRLNKMLDHLEAAMREDSGLMHEVANAIPALLKIPGLAETFFPGQKALMAMLVELITEHRVTRDPDQPRDLTDAFLDEVQKAKGNPESTFNDDNLRMVVFDLFTAGMVTTSTTLAWGLLLMILHPDVQSEPSLQPGPAGDR